MPNRFGLAIFQPELNQAGVSAKAELFCRLLAAKYRINLFDNVSTRGAQRRAETAFCEDEQWQRTHFFRACAATLDRNVDTVARLLRDGVHVMGSDSDGRTLLHFAVTAEQVDICRMLLAAGASAFVKDR